MVADADGSLQIFHHVVKPHHPRTQGLKGLRLQLWTLFQPPVYWVHWNCRRKYYESWPHFSWTLFFHHFPKSSWINPPSSEGIRFGSAMEGTEDVSKNRRNKWHLVDYLARATTPAFAARSVLLSLSFAVSTLSIPATWTCLLGYYPDQTEWVVVGGHFFGPFANRQSKILGRQFSANRTSLPLHVRICSSDISSYLRPIWY